MSVDDWLRILFGIPAALIVVAILIGLLSELRGK